MTCCFTGAMLVFEKDLQEWSHYDRYFVKQKDVRLPVEQLVSNVRRAYPTATIASVKIYPNPERSVEIGISLPVKNAENGVEGKGKVAHANTAGISATNNSMPSGKEMHSSGPAGGRPTHTVFINPYTGQVLELYSYRETFFYTMFSLHRWLLGGDDSVGKTITGISTFLFLFILLTGIILWWPRNKAILKQRLRIKSGAGWKRLNHDFHIVLGFYSAIFLFIFAFTALAWPFQWFNDGIYTVTNSPMKSPDPPRSVPQEGKQPITYEAAYYTIRHTVMNVQYYSLRAPNNATGIFTATVLPAGAHETAADTYYIDQYSGQIIGDLKFADKNLGQRVRATFKPVHVGSICGLPSKVVAFIVCLLGVTFPVTGIIIWINRLRKKKRRTVLPVERISVV
jgi:uncharacterized iron-regulated membrane protein